MLPLESGQKDIAKNMDKLKFYNVEVFTKDYYKINTEKVTNEEEEHCHDDLNLEEEEHCDDDNYENYDYDEDDNYDDT